MRFIPHFFAFLALLLAAVVLSSCGGPQRVGYFCQRAWDLRLEIQRLPPAATAHDADERLRDIRLAERCDREPDYE